MFNSEQHSVIYSTFGLYLALMLIIGFIGYKSTKSLNDYILGGRSLGAFVTGLSAGASDMSGWLLMGLPGAVFISGISEAWIAIGLIIGAYFNWKFVAQRLRIYTEHAGDSLTLPNFFAHRFNDENHHLRIISSLVILIFFTIYCSSGIVAGALLFSNMFEISYQQALIISVFATISYVFIGGFLAVSWTDTIQASLMIFALVFTVISASVAIMNIDLSQISATTNFHENSQNISGISSVLDLFNPSQLDLLTGTSVIGIISAMAWGLGYFGQPHILVRFMAAESAEKIPSARRISMTWMIICLAAAIIIGMVGIAYFRAFPELAQTVNKNSETIFLELANHVLNPFLIGVIMAAILAAIMSTLSCQLLVCSSSLTDDFYRTFLRPKASQTELVWVGRFMVLLVSAIACYLSLDPNNKVLTMVSYAWAGFGASFGSVILLSLFWHRMNKNGALAGIIVGATTVLLWKNLFAETTGIYEIIPGFIFALIAAIWASLMSKSDEKVSIQHQEFLGKI